MRWIAVAVVLALTACAHPHAPNGTGGSKLTLAVLPAESDAFPNTAKRATESLVAAKVTGVDSRVVSKVSLEVVQLAVECVDETPACYVAVGKSLAANRLLFARVATETGTTGGVAVTVTLFDVDAGSASAEKTKVFPDEAAAKAGVAGLVAEATRS